MSVIKLLNNHVNIYDLSLMKKTWLLNLRLEIHITVLDYEFLMVSYLILGKTKTCGSLLAVPHLGMFNEEPQQMFEQKELSNHHIFCYQELYKYIISPY